MHFLKKILNSIGVWPPRCCSFLGMFEKFVNPTQLSIYFYVFNATSARPCVRIVPRRYFASESSPFSLRYESSYFTCLLMGVCRFNEQPKVGGWCFRGRYQNPTQQSGRHGEKKGKAGEGQGTAIHKVITTGPISGGDAIRLLPLFLLLLLLLHLVRAYSSRIA